MLARLPQEWSALCERSWNHHGLFPRTVLGGKGGCVMNQRQVLASRLETAKLGRLPRTGHKGRARTEVSHWAKYTSVQ